jgi:aryl-alcohol dehydrogenase-like predicted oxidoreductase
MSLIMKHVFLGRSGLRVSELAMGTQTFGWGVDAPAAEQMANTYEEAGGNFFDTSSTYNEGASESILGDWTKKRGNRHAVTIASKVFFPTGPGPNAFGLSRGHILRTAEESLRRLSTDFIDVFQAHCHDRSTPIDETLRAFDDLVRSGKVRYVGASNFAPAQLMKALMLSASRGWMSFCSLQAEYSLLVRSAEWELLPVCREEGVGFLAWSPLAGGWLTGKYGRDRAPSPESRVGRGERWDDLPAQRESEQGWRVIDALIAVARRVGKTPTQVALNYLLGGHDAVIPIFGARTPAQLSENLGASGWELPGEDRETLAEVSATPLPYPYSYIERYTRKRV